MKIKQLKIGFMEEVKGGIKGCSSVTLIQGGKKNILVDTGGRGFHEEISKALRREKLTEDKIDYIILTHNHQDHTFNLAFYENAKIISSGGTLTDKFVWNKLPVKIGKNIEIISTPGHSEDSCSVIVNAGKETYAITGDLFFNSQDKLPSFEKNKKEILKERGKMIKIADYVIPGHGKMFKVKK